MVTVYAFLYNILNILMNKKKVFLLLTKAKEFIVKIILLTIKQSKKQAQINSNSKL